MISDAASIQVDAVWTTVMGLRDGSTRGKNRGSPEQR